MKTATKMTGRSYARSGFDRRAGVDRRVAIDLDYMEMLGYDRRRAERRSEPEKRRGWIRYTEWSSVFVGDVKP